MAMVRYIIMTLDLEVIIIKLLQWSGVCDKWYIIPFLLSSYRPYPCTPYCPVHSDTDMRLLEARSRAFWTNWQFSIQCMHAKRILNFLLRYSTTITSHIITCLYRKPCICNVNFLHTTIIIIISDNQFVCILDFIL